MTEKPGGSDVGNTETIARPVSEDPLMYRLHGIKASATPPLLLLLSLLALMAHSNDWLFSSSPRQLCQKRLSLLRG